MNSLNISLVTAEEVTRSWLSAVDMAADRMAERSNPDTRAGKIFRTMVINTVEES